MNRSWRCLVCSVESDSHSWNLIYLQKLVEEHGATVRNLGCCTPASEVVQACRDFRPDLVVVSSVNGDGQHGVRVLLATLRRDGIEIPVVAGGKLTTSEADNDGVRRDLLTRGCAEVFTGDSAVSDLRDFLAHHEWTPRVRPVLLHTLPAAPGPGAEVLSWTS